MPDIPIVEADCFKAHPSIRFGMSTKLGGVSLPPLGMNLSFSVGDTEANVTKNRERFFGNLHIKPDELAEPRQVHGNRVRVASEPGRYAECDALVTGTRRVFLCVSVADCVPLFLFDRRNHVVAAIHAGWRGTAGNIVSRTLEVMKSKFASHPTDCVAFVGPAASVCCYTVGEDVALQFDPQFVVHRNGNTFVDLKSANVHQLESCGIAGASIEVSPLCTITESEFLHSYRREKEASGRMMGVIGFV